MINKKTALGKEGLTVPDIGLGCMGMTTIAGADIYGKLDEGEAIRTIHRSLELGIVLVAYSPLVRGFISGDIKSPDDFAADDFRRTIPRFQGRQFYKNLELLKAIEQMAAEKGITLSQLAIAWVVAKGHLPATATMKLV